MSKHAPEQPASAAQAVLCPYCGHTQDEGRQCRRCRGLFEPLSRQATQNSMGPWQIRDEANPFTPGCSLETIRALIARGRIKPDSIVRGPTTHQFWRRAAETPGLAHLLGSCHACHASAHPSDKICPQCAESFLVPEDRQRLGLAPVRSLNGPVSESPLSPVTERAAAPRPAPVLQHAPAPMDLPFGAMAGPKPRRAPRSSAAPAAIVALLGVVGVAAALIVLKPFQSDNQNLASNTEAVPPSPPVDSTPAATDPAPTAEVPAPAPEGVEPWRTRVEDAARLAASGREDDIREALTLIETFIGGYPDGQVPLELAAERERLALRLEQTVLRRFIW